MIFSQDDGLDLHKVWVNDATCVQNSRHVEPFMCFCFGWLRDIHFNDLLFEFLSNDEFKFAKMWEDWDADMMMMRRRKKK